MINTMANGNLGEKRVLFRLQVQVVAHHLGKSRQEHKAGRWHRNRGEQLLALTLWLALAAFYTSQI